MCVCVCCVFMKVCVCVRACVFTWHCSSSGPLFSFDVHEDVRLVNDAGVEKDEVCVYVCTSVCVCECVCVCVYMYMCMNEYV